MAANSRPLFKTALCRADAVGVCGVCGVWRACYEKASLGRLLIRDFETYRRHFTGWVGILLLMYVGLTLDRIKPSGDVSLCGWLWRVCPCSVCPTP